ncbi:hypothetical protein [Sphingomonas sp.]|uniref:hypothetical protein n=1 Tax=Sphingomonas sp. TaxID=28214 RepID=UPI001EC06EC5|nr:hypothetical protein [Sphingomonas sp.]MBX3594514.1 hypothetical protein [Sphingomonas sp.]
MKALFALMLIAGVASAAEPQEPGGFTPSPPPSDSNQFDGRAPTRRKDPERLSDAEARKMVQAYAACTMRGSVREVRAYLATFPMSAPAGKLGQALARFKCARVDRMYFTDGTFRGIFYEALYRRDFSSKWPSDFSAVPPIDYGKGVGVETVSDPGALIGLRRFADCVVRTDPGGARTFVMSAIAEPGERNAVQALIPTMQKCVIKDRELKFSPSMARALVAEALYRLSEKATEVQS